MLGVQRCHIHTRTNRADGARRRSCPPGFSSNGVWIAGSTPLGAFTAGRMGSASVHLCTAAHSGSRAFAAPGSAAASAADSGNSGRTQAEA